MVGLEWIKWIANDLNALRYVHHLIIIFCNVASGLRQRRPARQIYIHNKIDLVYISFTDILTSQTRRAWSDSSDNIYKMNQLYVSKQVNISEFSKSI